MPGQWLTPDSAPTDFTCRRIMIPNQEDWLAIFYGCLNLLIYSFNFEPYGTATPEETATVWRAVFDDTSFQTGCRMIGEIIPYAGSSSPLSNWLACDGSSLLRADYPDLFVVIGTTYGSADGTHFNLPDLRGRAAIAMGTGTGLTPRTIGDSIGEETHQLTTSELAAHSHSEITAVPALGAAIVGVPVPSAVPGISSTGNAGGDAAHNNIQPSLAINYLIVALP
jgi:microcystin-dependent protein